MTYPVGFNEPTLLLELALELRMAAAFLAVLLALILALSRKEKFVIVAGCLLFISLAAYLVVPGLVYRQSEYQAFHWAAMIAVVVSSPLAFAFWLLSKAIFGDQKTVHSSYLFLLLLVVIIGLLGFQFERVLLFHRLIALTFILLAISGIYRGYDNDLIENRRHFRRLFLTSSCIYIVVVLAVEILGKSSDEPFNSASLELLNAVGIMVLLFLFSLKTLGVQGDFFGTSKKIKNAKTAANPEWIERLNQLVEVDKVYTQDGLTIGDLAKQMEVNEYQLRRLINQHMGYRNFNDYLNNYRIADACRMLTDPDNPRKQIAEIAFSLGYNSLSPFNRAFKETTEMTPTQYRKQHH